MAKYDVETTTIEKLLKVSSVSFNIPPFQRRYAWTDDQVSELVSDLLDDQMWLTNNSRKVPYFLGSIVLSQEGDGFSVLDGQQRLTTTSLLLAVLKDRLEKQGYRDASQLGDCLVGGKLGEPKTPKIRLQPKDKEVYEVLITNPTSSIVDKHKKHSLCNAFITINEIINKYTKNAEENKIPLIDVYQSMAMTIMYKVEIVKIVAPSEGAAFQLFETLNDRGLALNAADLIKNKLFARCGDRWINNAIDAWQETVEMIGQKDIVGFLRHYWIAFEGPIAKAKLYDKFSDQLNELNPSQSAKLAKQIRLSAEIYRYFVNPNLPGCSWDTEVIEGLQRLVAFGTRSHRPALLLCIDQRPQDFPFLVRACEAIVVRYLTVGQGRTNYIDKTFANLCTKLKNNPDSLNNILIEIFEDIPNDKEFTKLCKQIEVRRTTPAWRQFFVRLNDFVSTGETRIEGSQKVHIEHILPQTPSQDALSESKLTNKKAESLMKRIGNLTLLSGKKNRKLQNKPFSNKRPAFETSEIALNKWIASRSTWGKAEIEERSAVLTELAIKAWPWPPQ